MRGEAIVEIDGHTYRLACPIGAFEEIAAINPYLRRVIAELQGVDCNFKIARQIVDIGLRWADDQPTAAEVYTRHGWAAFQEMALAMLVAGFAMDDPSKKDEAAAETPNSDS